MKQASSRHIVILHGWTLSPTVTQKWQPFIKLLKKAGLTVHFWPLPGLTIPSATALTIEDYLKWLRSQTRSLPPFILMGHSFGGQLAIKFSVKHPEKVRQLILIDSSGIVDTALPKVIKRTLFKFFAKVGKVILPSPALKKLLYRAARENDYYQADPVQQATMRNMLSLTAEVSADLPKVTAPTLVIWGRRDAVTPVKFARVFSQRIPGAQLVILPDARHSPVYTHPQEVLSAVQKFLQ